MLRCVLLSIILLVVSQDGFASNVRNLTEAYHDYSEWVESVIEQELSTEEKNNIEVSKLDSLIQTLFQHPKILTSKKVFKDFIIGESTTRVIVNLHRSSQIHKIKDLKNKENRWKWKQIVKQSQNKVVPNFLSNNIRIKRKFKYVFGFSAEVTLEGLKDLIENTNVLSIQKTKIFHAQLAQGMPLINATDVRSTYNGSGIGIAICDTGIDYTHPRLGGGGFPNSKVVGGYDFGDNDADPMDQNGHGTACAGIAAGALGTEGDYIGGIANDAKLYALKISFGSGGSAYEDDMVAAWEWSVDNVDSGSNPIKIISTSFGGGRYFGSCNGDSLTMTAAAVAAELAGITIFAASGNEGYCDSIGWPACISNVISVGAVYDDDIGRNPPKGYVGCLDKGSCVGNKGRYCLPGKWYEDDPANEDQVTTYSNSASFLDLLAPSNWATTTKMGGGYWDTANGFGGTSAATPYAAGAAVCLQSAALATTGSYLDPAEVRSKLINTGDQITDPKSRITKPRVNLGTATFTLSSSFISVISPNGGESYNPGGNINISWGWDGSVGSEVSIELLKGGVVHTVIDDQFNNTGSYSWEIPGDQELGLDYRIRVSSTVINDTDESDADFVIENCAPITECPINLECGDYSDGCGGSINCGTCSELETCIENSCYCDDSDGDGICADIDVCPAIPNPGQEDADGDGKGDVCDNCPSNCNVDQLDADNDGEGDVCDGTAGCGGCGQPACESEC